MGKGSRNQTVTNVQKLPDAVEKALNEAYEGFNPFGKTFDAIGEFNPQVYDGPTMAEFSALQNAAISNAENLIDRPAYLDQAQSTFTDFAQGNTGIGFDDANLQRLVNATNPNSVNYDPTGLQAVAAARNPNTVGFDQARFDTALGQSGFDPSGLQRMATSRGTERVGFDDTNLSRLSNQVVDMSRLEGLFGSEDPAIAQLRNLSQQTTSLDPLTAQQNRENLATGLLGALAVDPGTNPMLQQQLDSAISGAVDKATSQYATAGRLGSNAFGSALGAGITNAAAPIIAQNLQQDRANRLAAAQALGNVSSDDLSREANLGQNIVGAGQTNLSNQVDATRALSAAFGQNLGQNTDIATNLISANQADLARQLQASDSLARNQITTSQANADLEQQDLARQLQAINQLAANQQTDAGRQADLLNTLSGRQIDASRANADIAAQDLARQLSAEQALATNQLGLSEANANLAAQDLARQLQAANTLAGNQLSASQASAAAQLDAASRLPSLLTADQSRISTLQDLGALQQAPAQAAIDAQIQRINAQNAADQNRINALLAASGMGQGMFGSTTTQTGGGPSALSSGLGGALAGASLANTLNIAGLTPSMGAIGGGLLGLLTSDRRLKKDIKKIGTHANGLPLYKWDWNAEAHDLGFEIYPTEGFMAQEVKEVYPQHVYTHPSGYMMLDYASLNNEVAGAA